MTSHGKSSYIIGELRNLKISTGRYPFMITHKANALNITSGKQGITQLKNLAITVNTTKCTSKKVSIHIADQLGSKSC